MNKSPKKSDKRKLVQVRLDLVTVSRLQEGAKIEHRSLSAHIAFILEKGLSNQGADTSLRFQADLLHRKV